MGPFLGIRLQRNRLETVKTLHDQLVTWEKQVPDSLRLASYESDVAPEPWDPPLLQLGALALQLSYNNLQIILHRSVAFENTSQEFDLGGGESGTESATFSRQQLLESALRTSEVHRYSKNTFCNASWSLSVHVRCGSLRSRFDRAIIDY